MERGLQKNGQIFIILMIAMKHTKHSPCGTGSFLSQFGNGSNGLLGLAGNGQRVHDEVVLDRHSNHGRQTVQTKTVCVLSSLCV